MFRLLSTGLATGLAVATLVTIGGAAARAADFDYPYGPPPFVDRPPPYERPFVERPFIERPFARERPVIIEERPDFAPPPYGYRYHHRYGRRFYARPPFFPHRHYAYGPRPYRFGY